MSEYKLPFGDKSHAPEPEDVSGHFDALAQARLMVERAVTGFVDKPETVGETVDLSDKPPLAAPPIQLEALPGRLDPNQQLANVYHLHDQLAAELQQLPNDDENLAA